MVVCHVEDKGFKSLVTLIVVISFTVGDILLKALLKIAISLLVFVKSFLVLVSSLVTFFLCMFPRAAVFFLADVALPFLLVGTEVTRAV